ncbi:MAG: hypothetical protein WA151_17430 [Desulfatirhabdiaceae bacterium]
MGAGVKKNTSVREKIINDFSEWTAFSATRSGCPIKSRVAVYPLIRTPKYRSILTGNEISASEFNDWHQEATRAICNMEPVFPVGWAAKLINIYLKTMVYLAGVGKPGLVQCIHPPIDNGLWEGIFSEYKHRRDSISKTHIVKRIKDIETYDKYRTIIGGCRLTAMDRGCHLIEVEELWRGTEI